MRSMAAAVPAHGVDEHPRLQGAILASGQPGNAEVELPLRLDIQDGKEIVRGSDGLAQAILERPIATFTLDRSGV